MSLGEGRGGGATAGQSLKVRALSVRAKTARKPAWLGQSDGEDGSGERERWVPKGG